MKLSEAIELLPNTKGCVIVLSGGMDSTISMRLAVQKYGAENVSALSFFYGQKQEAELQKASESTAKLSVAHKIVDASFLGDISQGFSANVDSNIAMPTIQEVLGDPTPKTYVPNRNMILMSITAAYAETRDVDTIVTGLQVHDEYGYWDTSQRFVDKMNAVFQENRKIKVKLIAPFSQLSKLEELELLQELDGNLDLLASTLTCYNPNEAAESCGKCPSCSERIANFAKFGMKDPVPYSIPLDWVALIERMKK